MRYFLDFRLERGHILKFHSPNDDHGHRSLTEFVKQDILTDHRLNIFRKICQHVIIDPGIKVPDSGRYKEHDRRDEDHMPQLYDPFANSLHDPPLLNFFFLKFR